MNRTQKKVYAEIINFRDDLNLTESLSNPDIARMCSNLKYDTERIKTRIQGHQRGDRDDDWNQMLHGITHVAHQEPQTVQ